MTIRTDSHLHTRFSDGEGTPADYARQAIARGLEGYVHTDHQPLTDRHSDWHMPAERLDEYIQAVLAARTEFPQLWIGLGLELEYWPGIASEIQRLSSYASWDFLIGSVHYIGDFNVDSPFELDTWRQSDVTQVWQDYFTLLAEAAASGWYDTIGHPDLVKKFNFIPDCDLRLWYGQLIDAASASGVALEINTAGLGKPCREIYPHFELLRMAREAGIPITLGSDAHHPDHLATNMEQAAALARQAGYREYLWFVGRQPRARPLLQD